MSFFDKIEWIITNYWQQFLNGIATTLELAFLGTIFGLILALVLGSLRVQKKSQGDTTITVVLKNVGSTFSRIYITIFRGTPMLVQAMIIYYGMASAGMRLSPFAAGLLTVTLNTTAYLAEVIRGGIQSVDQGQIEAARSLGMNQFQTFIHVVLPQAVKNTFPSIGNEFIVNIKDTAVLGAIQVVDLYKRAEEAGSAKAIYFESMLMTACIYLFLTYVTSKILNLIESRMGMEVKGIASSN